ncbi:AlpA family transcriptional regulator [Dyadobacter sp. 3J3]|uniref:helix-turn-helix transcriptional regulator n=1 Tax=Dyadobacter sp. 3J3 TaxID=2606600 RepID=UPI00135A6F7A|nr:helix-turn-helix domain-containing protein [Dyadobacter sp. 3J3]
MSEIEIPYYSKKVLTLDELVKYTGFSKNHVYRLTSQSKIPHSKPTGKSIFFEREKIEEWLLRGYVKTNEEVDNAVDNFLLNHSSKRKTKPKPI